MKRTVRPQRRRLLWGAAVGAASTLAVAGPAVALSGTDTIRTFAGNGTAASTGDGGPAVAAAVNGPVGISAAPDGRLLIPERPGNRVRVVGTDGVIRTAAGTGVPGFSGDGGPATAAQLSGPADAALDGSGNVYIADRDNNRIRRVGTNGIITTIAGTGVRGFSGDGGPAVAAQLDNPVGVTVDAAGNVYVADAVNRRIRRISTAGIITTVAGDGTAGSTGDGGPATAARFVRPDDVRVDAIGSLLVVDSGAHRVRRIDSSGVITTVAGTGTPGFGGDGGPAAAAELSAPIEVAPDAFGNLYIADTNNNRVRRVNAAGVISTIAGTGTPGFGGDGNPAISALLNRPSGAALNVAGDLFIGDMANNRVRVVENPLPSGEIPEGTAACGLVPATPARRGTPGQVKLTAPQLLINQRISQAAVRRVNAVQKWLDDGLVSGDLCGGAFIAVSFGPGITVGSTSVVRPETSQLPKPRPVVTTRARPGTAGAVRLEAAQLLISQRISQAAVRRANALTARLDNKLTGGNLGTGAITVGKLASGLAILSAVQGPEPPPSRTVVATPPRGRTVTVELSARQILINQRIAQAAVRRSNDLVNRLKAGFSARDFQPGTITARNLGPGVRP